MKSKRKFYKKIWFWVVSSICFFILLGSYYNVNSKEIPDIKTNISEFSDNEEIYIHFIDVGQADCIFIDAGDTDILIDAGNKADSELVVNYLKNLKTDDIELIIATHPHEDHIGGMVSIINNFNIDLILKPGISSIETKTSENFEKAIEQYNISNKIPSFEEQFIYGDLIITILSDRNKIYTETNDFSIVCRIDYLNNSFIFTGDAESPVEHDIIKSNINLKADVLKIGHHGGATSTTALFLKKISPQYAIISVGNNNMYGHPDNIIVNRLQLNGIETYRTDLNGTIIVQSDGSNIKIIPNNSNIINTNETSINSYNIEIIELDKRAERVAILNKGDTDINLTGWYLLSSKGEQVFYFPDNYIIKSNQTIKIVGYNAKNTGDFNWEQGKGIWNNSADDDAKLLDNHKNLISFYDDGQ